MKNSEVAGAVKELFIILENNTNLGKLSIEDQLVLFRSAADIVSQRMSARLTLESMKAVIDNMGKPQE